MGSNASLLHHFNSSKVMDEDFSSKAKVVFAFNQEKVSSSKIAHAFDSA